METPEIPLFGLLNDYSLPVQPSLTARELEMEWSDATMNTPRTELNDAIPSLSLQATALFLQNNEQFRRVFLTPSKQVEFLRLVREARDACVAHFNGNAHLKVIAASCRNLAANHPSLLDDDDDDDDDDDNDEGEPHIDNVF